MPTMTLTIEDAITLPGMGMVTGTITYTNGCSATREDPGEEAGIEDVSLRDAFGTDLDPEMILEDAARYTALVYALLHIVTNQHGGLRVGEHRDIHYW